MRSTILPLPVRPNALVLAAFVDAYLIAIGAAGILWMFPVVFLDQFVRNAFISRVSVESAWLCLAWILNLGMCSFVATAGYVLTPSQLVLRLLPPYYHP